MLKSTQQYDAPITEQVGFWNDWNAHDREHGVGDYSLAQAAVVKRWLNEIGKTNPRIIEIGCGVGWMCAQLTPFGDVTGTDLADQVLARAAKRVPNATFIAGDFLALDIPPRSFDVAVTLEVLAHVADQPRFFAKAAEILADDGYLMIATQNRPVCEKNDIPPPGPGQIRHWVDRHELAGLLRPHFEVRELFSIEPQFDHGWLRYLNSRKLHRYLAALRLGVVSRTSKRLQERAWLGWTLMALARKRSS